MSTNRILSGSLASYLNTAVSMVSNLVLVPMYLFYFGKEEYGLWLLVLSIVSYLGFSNLGIAQSVANFVASNKAENGIDEINSIVATGFWLYVSIVILVVIFIIGAVLFAPLGQFLNVPETLEHIVVPVIVISSTFFLLRLPLSIFNVTLRSLNLIYQEQLFGLLFTIIQFIGVVAVLLSGVGIIGLSVVYGATGALSGVVLCVYLHKLVPGFSFSSKFASKTMVKKLMTPGGYFFLLQLASGLIWATDNVIISSTIGLGEVAAYAIVFKVFMLTIGIVSVITSSMMPSITAAYAQNNVELLSNLYVSALKLCFGLGLLAALIMGNVGPELMIKWVGVDNYVGDNTFYFIVCLIFISIILWPCDAILVATTRHKGYALMAVVEGFINVGLSIWWINIWGVAGVAAATLTARLATNGWYMFHQAYVVTGIGITVLVVNVIKLFIVPTSGVIVALFILNNLGLLGWYKIITNISVIGCIFALLFYFISLNEIERLDVKRYIGGLGLFK